MTNFVSSDAHIDMIDRGIKTLSHLSEAGETDLHHIIHFVAAGLSEELDKLRASMEAQQ